MFDLQGCKAADAFVNTTAETNPQQEVCLCSGGVHHCLSSVWGPAELHDHLHALRSPGAQHADLHCVVTTDSNRQHQVLHSGNMSHCRRSVGRPVLVLTRSHSSDCVVQDCLSLFFQQTILTGGEQKLCSVCELRRETTVLTCLEKPPEILTLHLKRWVALLMKRGQTENKRKNP